MFFQPYQLRKIYVYIIIENYHSVKKREIDIIIIKIYTEADDAQP